MAAELKVTQPELKVILVHSRSKLLSAEPLPDDLRDCVMDLVHEAGVETVMDARVVAVDELAGKDEGSYRLSLSNGSHINASVVINAVSKFVPTTEYLPDAVLGEQGYVMIKPKYVMCYIILCIGLN